MYNSLKHSIATSECRISIVRLKKENGSNICLQHWTMASRNTYPTNKPRLKLVLNAPVILMFVFLSIIAFVLGRITDQASTKLLFSVYRSSPADPFTYIRFLGYVFGNTDLKKFFATLIFLLVLGPVLEERFHGKILLIVIIVSSVVSGILCFIFFPDTILMGSDAVVFAFVLLSPLKALKKKELPMTFILIIVIGLCFLIYSEMIVEGNTYQITNMVGGITGCMVGYRLSI